MDVWARGAGHRPSGDDHKQCRNVVQGPREKDRASRDYGKTYSQECARQPPASGCHGPTLFCGYVSEPLPRGAGDAIPTQRRPLCCSVIELSEGNSEGGRHTGGPMVENASNARPYEVHFSTGADSSGNSTQRLFHSRMGGNFVTLKGRAEDTRLVRGTRILVPRNKGELSYNLEGTGIGPSRAGIVRVSSAAESWGGVTIIHGQHGDNVCRKQPREQIPPPDARAALAAPSTMQHGRDNSSKVSSLSSKSICRSAVTVMPSIRLPPNNRKWARRALLDGGIGLRLSHIMASRTMDKTSFRRRINSSAQSRAGPLPGNNAGTLVATPTEVAPPVVISMESASYRERKSRGQEAVARGVRAPIRSSPVFDLGTAVTAAVVEQSGGAVTPSLETGIALLQAGDELPTMKGRQT